MASAPRSGRGGRKFESSHPDKRQMKYFICRFFFAQSSHPPLFLPYAHAQKMDELRKRLHAYVDTLDATVGVAVITAEDDSLTVNNDIRYPMMSVFKFHQALALSDYMAGKHLPLETRIRIKPEDLQLKGTWSPLRDKYPNGGVELTIADLMTYTLRQSDNLACDIRYPVRPFHVSQGGRRFHQKTGNR